MSSPFYPPVAPPQEVGAVALGNLQNRVKTLEAVVPPEFSFTPTRPFAYGSGSSLNVPDGFPFVSVAYFGLTPFDSLFFDPEVFSDDSSDNLYLNKIGVYEISWGASFGSALGSANDTFRGPIWIGDGISGGGGAGGYTASYTDNSGVYNTWSVSGSASVFVVEADLPVLVSLFMGHYCVNTGPHAADGDPIDLNVQWALMATYLDGFSPTEP